MTLRLAPISCLKVIAMGGLGTVERKIVLSYMYMMSCVCYIHGLSEGMYVMSGPV